MFSTLFIHSFLHSLTHPSKFILSFILMFKYGYASLLAEIVVRYTHFKFFEQIKVYKWNWQTHTHTSAHTHTLIYHIFVCKRLWDNFSLKYIIITGIMSSSVLDAHFYSAWASDAIWWHRFRSRLAYVPRVTKVLPEPVLTYHQWSPVTFIGGQFHKWYLSHPTQNSLEIYSTKMSFKSPWAQELI